MQTDSQWWVVVCDGARARIFSAQAMPAPLQEVEDLIDASGRLAYREIDDDRAGRAFDSFGGGRHAMAEPTEPHDKRRAQFARRIADRVEAGRRSHDFAHLAIGAPPYQLGDLRTVLAPASRALCGLELARELTALGSRDIEQHLRRALERPAG